MKAINVLLALLVSLAIALGVFEGGLRLIGKGPRVTLNAFDEHTGWGNKPGQTLTTPIKDKGPDVTFDFNEYGLRESGDVKPEKPANTKRVLCLGDSFTLGRYTAKENTFVSKLDEAWDGVQVVNVSAEGWSTDQQAAWLLAHADEWKPDLVLVFPYENDVFWCGETEYAGFAKPRFFELGGLETKELENNLRHGWTEKTAIGHLFKAAPQVPEFQPGKKSLPKEFGLILDEQPDFMQDAIDRCRGAFFAMEEKCDDLGIEMVVVPIPSEVTIHPKARKKFEAGTGLQGVAWSGDNAVDCIIDQAKRGGVSPKMILDPRDDFRARDAKGEVLYFDVDWHLNDAGNVALAEFVAKETAALGLSPEGAKIAPTSSESSGGLPGWLPWFVGLWLILGVTYMNTYKEADPGFGGFLKVGGLLAMVFTIAIGGMHVIGLLPPTMATLALMVVILVILGFVAYKLGDRLETIAELLAAFIGRGHWYLMPLVTILLTVGSLLVVAASSPLVAPFIYTLF